MQKTSATLTHSFMFINLASESEVLELKRKKNLIGSYEGSDVILKDASISHYHALAIIQDDGIMLMDLQSTNGLYINGTRVEKGMVFSGDTFSLGNKVFRLEENIGEKITDEDAKVSLREQTPPPMPVMTGDIPKNLILIDDEYCDITFDDQKVIHLGKLPFELGTSLQESYIDPDEKDAELEAKIIETLKTKSLQEKSLEITMTMNGIVVHSQYFSSKYKTIKASPKKENSRSFVIETLTQEKVLIERKDQNLFLNPLPGFSLQKNSVLLSEEMAMPLTEGDLFILTQGLVQIFIRIVETPPELVPVSFFTKDQAFFKESARILLIALFLMIPTFFVKKPAEAQPDREIAVVYKRALPPPPLEKITKSAQGESMPTQEKSGGQKGGASQLKVASTKAPSSAPEHAPAPPLRAYKFASSGKLGSLFKSSANVGTVTFSTAGRGPSSIDTGIAVGKAGDGTIKLGSGGSGRLGSGGSGNGTGIGSGSGSGGLYNKNGIDTASIDSRTVVLGSIDPELLRKILREYLPQFRHCYQQELTENSEDLKGIVDLNFRIEGDGKVSSIDINSRDSRFSKKGTGCMASVLRMIDFPKPKGGGLVDVRQPLNFFAEKEKMN